MAGTSNFQRWPPYPHMPFYLESNEGTDTMRTYNAILPVSPRPEHSSSERGNRSLAVPLAQFAQDSRASAATQFTNLSPIWPIPPRASLPPPPPPKALPNPPKTRNLPSRPRSNEIPRRNAIYHESGPHVLHPLRAPDSYNEFGLGIQFEQYAPRTTSGASSGVEKGSRSSNIAQRIEEGLWRYSLSGNVIKRWLIEIISWWLSAICMGTIIGILIYHRDGRIPNWPGVLTLNALIAVLSKVAGAALILPVSEALGQLKWSWFQGHSKTMWDFEIFDNASRGPWGSILLLIRTKGRALAALGAGITLFSLVLDPFFQQVVDFPDRWALQGTSSIPRTIWYKPRYIPEFRAGKEMSQLDNDVYMATKKFFYDNGTQPVPFGNGTRPEIPISCPTSNCTWPAYQTLGVCSRCTEVSQLLDFACLETTADWVANLTGGYQASRLYPNATMCGWYINATSHSDRPILMSGYLTKAIDTSVGTASKNEVLLTRLLPLVTNTARTPLFGGSINFKDIRNSLLDVVIVSAANGTAGVLRNETPIAHECVISWCVKTIESAYYMGTYEERVINTVENTTSGDFPWHTKFSSIPGSDTIDISYSGNITIRAPTDVNGSHIVQYGMDNTTFLKVSAVFDDIFPSFYTATNISSVPKLRYKTNINGAPFQRVLDFNPWSAGNNITRHLERMTDAITNVVRSYPNASYAAGAAFSQETYVAVRWQWLALPLALLILSAVFLIATMKKTADEGVWKSSAIATLLYGLPDHVQKQMTIAAKGSTPRAKAKELKVRLHATKGWRLSGNTSPPKATKTKQYHPPPGWI